MSDTSESMQICFYIKKIIIVLAGKRAKILVCCAWGMAILFSTPMLYFNAIEVKGGNDQCWLSLPKTKEGQDSKIYWKVEEQLMIK